MRCKGFFLQNVSELKILHPKGTLKLWRKEGLCEHNLAVLIDKIPHHLGSAEILKRTPVGKYGSLHTVPLPQKEGECQFLSYQELHTVSTVR